MTGRTAKSSIRTENRTNATTNESDFAWSGYSTAYFDCQDDKYDSTTANDYERDV